MPDVIRYPAGDYTVSSSALGKLADRRPGNAVRIKVKAVGSLRPV